MGSSPVPHRDRPPRTGPHATDPDTRLAWLALAALPLSFLLATLLGDGLLAVQGYDSGGPVPARAVLLAGLPSLVVLVAPASAAVVLGHRAVGRGHRSGRLPAVLGAVAIVALITVNLLAAGVAA